MHLWRVPSAFLGKGLGSKWSLRRPSSNNSLDPRLVVSRCRLVAAFYLYLEYLAMCTAVAR
jgi:hypothetical protein